MATWQTMDQETADELRRQFSEDQVVPSASSRVFESGNAVILAPTSHAGEVLLITARRQPVPQFESVSELPLEANEPFVATIPDTQVEEPAEAYFGPTTWERIEEQEPPAFEERPLDTYADQQAPIASDRVYPAEPALPQWEEPPSPPRTPAPSYLDYRPEPETFEPLAENKRIPQQPVAPIAETPATPPQRERHYIASGFLGLEESVEDDEDIAREKRPWWKKIFTD